MADTSQDQLDVDRQAQSVQLETQFSPARPLSVRRGHTREALFAYRREVDDIAPEIACILAEQGRDGDGREIDQAFNSLTELLNHPALAPVLPSARFSAGELVEQSASFQPEFGTSVPNLQTWVRMYLLSQIEARWWGDIEPFRNDVQIELNPDLVDLEPLRRAGQLTFRYRRQPRGLVARALSWGQRHARRTFHAPVTAGLRFTRIRPECVALLNQLAVEWRSRVGRHDPPLWVTSVTRTLDHQNHLRSLGYSAIIPSAHCSGHAADIAVQWLERFGLAQKLCDLLLEYQDADRLNAIDEGPTWHICVHPDSMAELLSRYKLLVGS